MEWFEVMTLLQRMLHFFENGSTAGWPVPEKSWKTMKNQRVSWKVLKNDIFAGKP